MATVSPAPIASPPLPSVSTPPQGRVLLRAGLFLLPCLPLLIDQGRTLWSRPHYEFFPLVPLGATFLAWVRSRELGVLHPGDRTFSLLALAVLGAGLLTTGVIGMPWVGTFLTLGWLLVLAYAYGGGALLRAVLPAWVYLWLLVNPPFNLDQTLVNSLQDWTSRLSSMVLDYYGFVHLRDGNVIEVPGQRLLVEEACSGIHSFFAILACALFFVLWRGHGWVRGPLLLAASFFWVMASNVLRVTAVTVLKSKHNIDLIEGPLHELFGVVLFVLVLGLIWSTDRLLLFFDFSAWLPWRRGRSSRTTNAQATQWPNFSETPLATGSLRGLCGVVGGINFLVLALALIRSPGHTQTLVQALHGLKEEDAPTSEAWKRGKFEAKDRTRNSTWGDHSRTWQYRFRVGGALLGVNYPFDGWHELTACYLGNGWTVEERKVRSADTGPFVYVRMSRPLDQVGTLWFAYIDDNHQVVPPDESEDRWQTRLYARLSLFRPTVGRATGTTDTRPLSLRTTYQIQLLIESLAPLSPDHEKKAEQFFLDARTQLHERIARSEGGQP